MQDSENYRSFLGSMTRSFLGAAPRGGLQLQLLGDVQIKTLLAQQLRFDMIWSKCRPKLNGIASL